MLKDSTSHVEDFQVETCQEIAMSSQSMECDKFVPDEKSVYRVVCCVCWSTVPVQCTTKVCIVVSGWSRELCILTSMIIEPLVPV